MKGTELTALVVAASLMVGGTYAWNSFTQSAVNETVDGTKEAGGRLHDDFNGTNKDIYVENYTSPGAGEDIYARVRIREYFEYGELAGDITGASSTDVKLLRGDKQVSETPTIDDLESWDIYLIGSTPTMGIDTIRTYRDLEFAGSTIYMPTFNQDNTDLKADINGTLEGALGLGRGDSAESYTDYDAYNAGDTEVGNLVTADDPTGTSTTHIAKETLDSTVMTMSDWLDGGGVAGNYWVYDVDGWAYWAQPIEPDTATGLLLDEIVVKGNTDERWYYAVEVSAQVATAGDWGDDSLDTGMYGDITSDGLGLLNKVSGLLKVSSLVVTNNGTTIPNTTFNLPYVNGLNLIPELTVEYGTGASYETEVEWSITEISGDSGVTLDSNIFDNGKFNPTIDMIGSTYEITVTSKLTPSRTITYTITVIDIPEAIEIATEDDVVDVRNTESLPLYAYEENTTDSVSVTWSIVEASGNSGLTQEQINACLDENGVFTPDTSMAGCTYTVKATTPYDSVSPAIKTISVYDDSSVSLTVSSAGNVTTMTLSPTYYTLQMGTTITGLIDKSVKWNIVENSGDSGLSQTQINATLDEDGLFTVEDTMVGCSYTITATSKVDGTFYDSMTISIKEPTITVYHTSFTSKGVNNGDEVQVYADVVGLRNTDVTWSIDNASLVGATITTDGVVKITQTSELGNKITVTAVSKVDTKLEDDAYLSFEYRIPGSTYIELEEIEGTTTTVKSEDANGDDIEYYVLDTDTVTRRSVAGASEGDVLAVLLWATDAVTINGSITSQFDSANVSTWSSSTMNTTTLPAWMLEQTNLISRVVRVSVYTDGFYQGNDTTVTGGFTGAGTTFNEAWLLSQPEFLDYVKLGDNRAAATDYYWLRSPNTAGVVRIIYIDGTALNNNHANVSLGVRPALWIVP